MGDFEREVAIVLTLAEHGALGQNGEKKSLDRYRKNYQAANAAMDWAISLT